MHTVDTAVRKKVQKRQSITQMFVEIQRITIEPSDAFREFTPNQNQLDRRRLPPELLHNVRLSESPNIHYLLH